MTTIPMRHTSASANILINIYNSLNNYDKVEDLVVVLVLQKLL